MLCLQELRRYLSFPLPAGHDSSIHPDTGHHRQSCQPPYGHSYTLPLVQNLSSGQNTQCKQWPSLTWCSKFWIIHMSFVFSSEIPTNWQVVCRMLHGNHGDCMILNFWKVGVFSRLTNSYCLVALGGSEPVASEWLLNKYEQVRSKWSPTCIRLVLNSLLDSTLGFLFSCIVSYWYCNGMWSFLLPVLKRTSMHHTARNLRSSQLRTCIFCFAKELLQCLRGVWPRILGAYRPK